ncbi:MAG: hypothetical protein KGK33_14305 [Hyphomicrobiales bacterium]|nr:hypothetical protein [Hyphomicrobiales bacterium]
MRCQPGAAGCWRDSRPERTYAFSADAILHPSDLSRNVTAIDFSDPVWLRLGFINELRYNCYTAAGYFARALKQIPDWLSGPAESYATAPLNGAAIVILAYVVIRGRQFDPWRRLIGAAALA